MTKKYKIYTRTGDDGSTGLVGGSRTKKNSLRIIACGEADALNSFIGLVRAQITSQYLAVLDAMLEQIQHELFSIGAEIATPAGTRTPATCVTTKKDHVRLEEWIDFLDEALPPLRSFILPVGDSLVSLIHVSRAQCRSFERAVVTLSSKEKISKEISVYINRLSDLLFIMARYASHKLKIDEIPWEQGKRGDDTLTQVLRKNSSPRKEKYSKSSPRVRR